MCTRQWKGFDGPSTLPVVPTELNVARTSSGCALGLDDRSTYASPFEKRSRNYGHGAATVSHRVLDRSAFPTRATADGIVRSASVGILARKISGAESDEHHAVRQQSSFMLSLSLSLSLPSPFPLSTARSTLRRKKCPLQHFTGTLRTYTIIYRSVPTAKVSLNTLFPLPVPRGRGETLKTIDVNQVHESLRASAAAGTRGIRGLFAPLEANPGSAIIRTSLRRRPLSRLVLTARGAARRSQVLRVVPLLRRRRQKFIRPVVRTHRYVRAHASASDG